MCIIRPQTGQIRSRTSSSQYAKSVSAGQRCGIVWTSLSRGSVPVVLKADKEDTREMAWFLAGCLAVEKKTPELTLDRTMHLLKSAMEAPELALGLAVLLVDYYIDRNKTATRSHTKTWLARHKNVRLLPL